MLIESSSRSIPCELSPRVSGETFGVSHVELTLGEYRAAMPDGTPTPKYAVTAAWPPNSWWVPADTRVTGTHSTPDEAAPELPRIVSLGSDLEQAGLRIGDELMWVNDTELGLKVRTFSLPF